MAFFDNIQANVGPKAAIIEINSYRIFDKYIKPGDMVYAGIEVCDNKLFNVYLKVRDKYKSTIGRIMDWWNNYCDEKEVNAKINNMVYNTLGFLLWGPRGAASYLPRQPFMNKLASIHIARVVAKSESESENRFGHSDEYCSKCSYLTICTYKNGQPFKKCLSVSGCPATGITKYQGYEDIKKCTIDLPAELVMKCIYEWNWRHGVIDGVFNEFPLLNKPTKDAYAMGRFKWWLFDKFYNIYIERIAKLK